MRSRFVKSDPLGGGDCPREDCTVCRRGEYGRRDRAGAGGAINGVSCWSTSVGYKIGCDRSPCRDRSPGGSKNYTSVYQGETSRTGYTRVGQHFSQYRRSTAKAMEDSWMWSHTMERHSGVRGTNFGINDYKPWILSSHLYPMDRQQEEGIRIKDDSLDPALDPLNSQWEYYKPEYLKFVWSK